MQEGQPQPLLKCLPPTWPRFRWLKGSGNQASLEACYQWASAEGLESRILCVSGESGSGMTTLLFQLEKQLRRNSQRVLSLRDDTDANERFILAQLVEELRLPNARKYDPFNFVCGVYEYVLALRRYMFIIIHDVERFMSFTRAVTQANFDAISLLLNLVIGCRIVIAGDSEAIEKYLSYFSGCCPGFVGLIPMSLGLEYTDFVHNVWKRYNGPDLPSTAVVKEIHNATGGLVGTTFTYLSMRSAEQAIGPYEGS